MALAIIFNVSIGALFVFSNYYIWNSLKEYPYTTADWSPVKVAFVPRDFVNGTLVSMQTIKEILNYPFFLFFLAIAINLFLIFKLQKAERNDSSKS